MGGISSGKGDVCVEVRVGRREGESGGNELYGVAGRSGHEIEMGMCVRK